MRLTPFAWTLLVVVAGALLVRGLHAADRTAPQGATVGAAAPEFALPDALTGKTIDLASLKGKIVVIEWDATQCPVAKAYDARVNDFVSKYATGAAAKVAFLAINSNETEPLDDIQQHAKAVDAKYAILKDAGSKVADLYGAKCTPHIFVVDAAGIVRYIGSIDDSQNPAKVTHHYLSDAVDALLAGKDVPVSQTAAFGCAIKRP